MLAVERVDRRNAGLLLLLAVGWLVYTRFFAVFRGAHLVLPPCPFLVLTGQPCPLCGATRGYAAVWRGDLGSAVRYHPLAPVFFAATVAGAVGLAFALAAGRRPVLRLRAAQQVGLFALGLGAVTLAWVLRLLFLPLPA